MGRQAGFVLDQCPHMVLLEPGLLFFPAKVPIFFHVMSEFPDFSEDKTEQSNREGARPSKVRRVSHVRVKKSPRAEKIADDVSAPRSETDEIPVIVETGETVEIDGLETNSHDSAGSPDSDPDWQDAAPETVGGAGSSSSSESAKRKRKRRRGKGGGSVPEEVAPAQAPVPKAKVNPEQLAKSAWKIYLAEISEEGVALVGDHDARDLARRCFRLAEIFLEEQDKRCGALASKS